MTTQLGKLSTPGLDRALRKVQCQPMYVHLRRRLRLFNLEWQQ